MLRVRPRFFAATSVMLWSAIMAIPAVAHAATMEGPVEPGAKSPPGAAPSAAAEAAPSTASPMVPAPAEPPAPVAAEPPALESAAPASPNGAEVANGPIAADMLDAEPTKAAAPTAPTVASMPSPAASEDEDLTPNEAITRTYAPKFRPKTNPGRLNVAARLMFANAGANGAGGGRLGGLSVDVGQSWNRFGYAVTATAFGGRYALAETGTAEINALLGAGPTIGLGRMALLGRGFLDLRLGYDVFYGVVNQRDTSTVVRPQNSSDVSLSPTRNLLPHGPRVRLDLGFVGLNDSRRYFHGIGVSMGYQALVGSFRGAMPVTHMLTLGLSYWLG